MRNAALGQSRTARVQDTVLSKRIYLKARVNSDRITGNLLVYGAQFASLPKHQLPKSPDQKSADVSIRPTSAQTQIALVAVGMICMGALYANSQTNFSNDVVSVPSPAIGKKTNSLDGNTTSTQLSGIENNNPIVIDAVSASKTVALTAVFNNQKTDLQSEIDHLQHTTVQLEATISNLSIETLELNQELLQKDLELVALKDEIAGITHTRVIYNFVNVPIGSDVVSITDGHIEPYANNDVQSIVTANSLSADDPGSSFNSDFAEQQDDWQSQLDDEFSDEYIDNLFTELRQQFSDDGQG